MPQLGASLTIIIDTLAQAKARVNKIYIVQASLTIVTYSCKNIVVQATAARDKENEEEMVANDFNVAVQLCKRLTKRLIRLKKEVFCH